MVGRHSPRDEEEQLSTETQTPGGVQRRRATLMTFQASVGSTEV
jgi:hypothetical protein